MADQIIGGGRQRKLRTGAEDAPPSRWGQRGVPKPLRAQVLRRDAYLCQLRLVGCTVTATEVDHITNVASLGVTRAQATDPGALQAVCVPCHRVKTASERTAGIHRHRAQRAAQKHRPDEPHPGTIA
ncbi:MAG: hypothetical protein QOC62_6023 [Mycobacterium sp.]|jgi:5-methylcytosine-specific restriction endonuclease McrA|nr:hypothetical protein [Mycobacterium sp.]